MYSVYISDSVNPYFNLAFEEYLVKHHDSEDQILFLWRNNNTVVIGKNQNPWKECNLAALESMGGNLLRRLSGGGAVYHDLGNLNFTFISPYSDGQIEKNMRLIIDVLLHNGIDASFSGKNDILVNGCKVSGNAFFAEDDTLCHHGTLLIDSELEKICDILTVSQNKLKSKGIDSVKSRIKNLKEFNKNISVEVLKRDLLSWFLPEPAFVEPATVNEETILGSGAHFHEIQDLMKRFESWDWNFGSSPEFNIQISERFAWGGVEIGIMVQDGTIADLVVETDSLDIDLPQKIKNLLLNKNFDYDYILSVLNDTQA